MPSLTFHNETPSGMFAKLLFRKSHASSLPWRQRNQTYAHDSSQGVSVPGTEKVVKSVLPQPKRCCFLVWESREWHRGYPQRQDKQVSSNRYSGFASWVSLSTGTFASQHSEQWLSELGWEEQTNRGKYTYESLSPSDHRLDVPH